MASHWRVSTQGYGRHHNKVTAQDPRPCCIQVGGSILLQADGGSTLCRPHATLWDLQDPERHQQGPASAMCHRGMRYTLLQEVHHQGAPGGCCSAELGAHSGCPRLQDAETVPLLDLPSMPTPTA